MRISSATDPANRTLDWTYPENNLTVITDWTNREVKLDSRTQNQYKITDASTATATLNTQLHFGNGPYAPPTAILVTKFVDALGNTYTYSYDTTQVKPSVTGLTNPGAYGSKGISYGTDGDENKTTTITDEEGHKRRETYHATTQDLIKIEAV